MYRYDDLKFLASRITAVVRSETRNKHGKVQSSTPPSPVMESSSSPPVAGSSSSPPISPCTPVGGLRSPPVKEVRRHKAAARRTRCDSGSDDLNPFNRPLREYREGASMMSEVRALYKSVLGQQQSNLDNEAGEGSRA